MPRWSPILVLTELEVEYPVRYRIRQIDTVISSVEVNPLTRIYSDHANSR